MIKIYLKLINTKIIVFFVNLLIFRRTDKIIDDGSRKRILILAPHPDDEIIGIGGIVLQVLQNKGAVYIVYLTDGEESGAWNDKERIKKERINISEEVVNMLNIPVENIYRLRLKDGKVPHRGDSDFFEVVKILTDIVEKVQPDTVFATHYLDYWPFDHVACSEMAIEIQKRLTTKTDFWFYWVWTWYHLKPWHLKSLLKRKLIKVDISNEHSQKMKLMNHYLQPKSPEGKPWSGSLPKSMFYPFTKPYEIIEKYE